MKRLILFSALSIFFLTISAQTNTWISANGNWSNSNKWSLNHVPNANEDVVIPAGSDVNLNMDGYTKSITTHGNAIFNIPDGAGTKLSFTNASSFSADSTFNWGFGTLSGGGTLTLMGNTFLISANSKLLTEGTTIINTGTIAIQGTGSLYIYDGVLTNTASGVINLQSPFGNIDYFDTGSHVFNNEGLIKRTGTGDTHISAEFHNNGGTITVEGGNLIFDFLTKYFTNGTYNVNAGSDLTFSVTPSGAESILSGTLTGVLNGDLTWLGKFSVPSAATFNFTGTNGVNWQDGSLMGGGTLTNLGNLKVTGDNSKFINDQSTFNNEGTILFQGTGEFVIDHGIVNNQPTGIIDIQSTYAYFDYGTGATHILHNYGLIKNTIATGSQQIRVELQNHDGTISVENGTLYLSGLSKYLTDGTYNVSPGARFYWNTEIVCAGTMTGVLDGDIFCSTSSIKIPSNTTAIFDFNGNTGVVWSYLDVNGPGTLINRSEITLLNSSHKFLKQNITVNNEGSMNFEDVGNLFVDNGTINNQATGIMDLQAGSILLIGTGALNNNGLLKRTTTTGNFAINVPTTNSGTISAMMGTLEFYGSLNNTVNGTVNGTATLDVPSPADFTNDGIFSPGGYPGTLTVLGDFKSSSTSKLQIELYGYTQGTEYDLLAVQGNAIMDGDIPVALYFAPNIGDEFIVLTANNITSCNLPATVTAHHNGHNYTFDVICNPDNVTLKITDIVLGTEENTLSNLSMYPNPSNGSFTINLGREYTDVTVQVINMLGQTISSEKYASAKTIEQEINASAGIYFVKVSTAKEGSNTLRIIKQ